MTKALLDANAKANLELIKRVYVAFDAKDMAALPALCAEDVEIYQSPELPWGGEFHGVAGAVQFFSTLLTYIDTRVNRTTLLAAGDHIIEVGRTQGRAHATGNVVDVAEIHVWTIRAGKVARMEAYVHHPDMLAALNPAT